MKQIRQLSQFLDSFNYVLFFASGIVIVLLMFIVLVDVFMRQIQRPLIGTIEIVGVGLIYFTFLGAAWVLKKGGHVHMDLVLNYATPRVKNFLLMIVYFVCMVMWALVTWYSAKTVLTAFNNNFVWPGLLQIPLVYILPAVTIGSFLLFIESFKQGLKYLTNFFIAKPVSEGDMAHRAE